MSQTPNKLGNYHEELNVNDNELLSSLFSILGCLFLAILYPVWLIDPLILFLGPTAGLDL